MKSPLALLIGLVALVFAVRAPAAPAEPGEAARLHFRRGVDLYEERDLNGAAIEFRRAYEVSPHYRVLYNLGQVAQEQHDWAAALDYFSRYLRDGAGQLPEERRAEIERETAKLRQRVGRLVIITHASDANVLVDGVSVARAPISGPINVNSGRRRVEVQDSEGKSQPQWIDVAGGETAVVELSLPVAPAVPPVSVEEHAPMPAPLPRTTGASTWWAWLGTGLCAAGAATTGVLAYRWSRDLHDRRDTFPVTQQDLLDDQRKVRRMAWFSDGLLAGAAVFAGISLYLSFRDQDQQNGLALGPASLSWKGSF